MHFVIVSFSLLLPSAVQVPSLSVRVSQLKVIVLYYEYITNKQRLTQP